MTREEYCKEFTRIEKQRTDAIDALAKEFAKSNNPYKIGDIIQDHIGKGRILNISFSSNALRYGTYPYCVYKCENLTKKGTVNKKEPFRNIYQINILPND